MRIKGADAEGVSCKDITCVQLLLFLGAVRMCSAGPCGCLKEPGGRVLGTTALLPRAARHTQRPVVSEKLCLPSCEHWPPGLPPPTPALGQSSRGSRDGYACYTPLGRRDLCHTLSHCHSSSGGTEKALEQAILGSNPAQPGKLGQTPRKPYRAVRSSLGLSFPICNTRVIARVLITMQLNTD